MAQIYSELIWLTLEPQIKVPWGTCQIEPCILRERERERARAREREREKKEMQFRNKQEYASSSLLRTILWQTDPKIGWLESVLGTRYQ